MGKLYCLMGKSAGGKDTVFRRLLEDQTLELKELVPYTTRPIRQGEQEGREYHFTDINGLEALKAQGKVIESRVYHTIHGDWYYFTVDDGQMDPDAGDYLMIGTLEAYTQIKAYFAQKGQPDLVVPIYIEVEDGLRLERALARERQQREPKYREMCRRFLADCEDFSEEKLTAAGITRRFDNTDLERCLAEVKGTINGSDQDRPALTTDAAGNGGQSPGR
ncbi:MAG: guanylate kinase [Lachnospiraceae bacterium]|nr:guanylate kinase [Lachnospiraceae bacterium]